MQQAEINISHKAEIASHHILGGNGNIHSTITECINMRCAWCLLWDNTEAIPPNIISVVNTKITTPHLYKSNQKHICKASYIAGESETRH